MAYDYRESDEEQPNTGTMVRRESIEGIDELTGMEGAMAPATEADAESGSADHEPMSSGTGRASETQDEAAETESAFESVAGWQPPAAIESDETDTEATVDAGSAEAGEEFFGAIAALVLPMAKVLLPQLAKAGAQAGSDALRRLIARRTAMLRRRMLVRPPRTGTESEFETEAALEAAMEAMEAENVAEALAQLEVVIGKDDRVRVMNTSQTPWGRICHLRITAGNGSTFLGTGFLVGRRTVVTAGHCVFLHNNGGWARSIEVSPGRNGTSLPFGKVTSTSFRSVKGWAEGRKRICDYGAIVLPQNLTRFPGSFAVQAFPDSQLRGRKLNTAGYPGDKAQSLPGSMWYHGRNATRIEPRVITYDTDTAGGQSGSPVWIRSSSGVRTAVAIHTNGAPSGNSATRIVPAVLANLKAWNQGG